MKYDRDEKLSMLGGCLILLTVCGYGLLQIWAGFLGIEDHWGRGWAIAAVVAAFFVRFTLPLTIGAFLCATEIWRWHWFGAFVFVAPGLAFMLLMFPAVFGAKR